MVVQKLDTITGQTNDSEHRKLGSAFHAASGTGEQAWTLPPGVTRLQIGDVHAHAKRPEVRECNYIYVYAHTYV